MKNQKLLRLRILIAYIIPLFVVGCSASGDNKPSSTIKVSNENDVLDIRRDDMLLMRYQMETVYPPEGVDSIYARSGFIHPINTPNGQRLTQIQPKGHYHHYGLWNPWTHVLFEGDTLDFWNLKKGQGTVMFVELNDVVEKSDTVQLMTTHHHVVTKDSTEIIALVETQSIKVHSANEQSYILDFEINLSCGTMSPFQILKYRYGGFTWRTTEQWHQNNSEVFTDLVNSRNEVDGSKGKWCVIQGELDNSYGGAIMMSNPSNINHPEPLRVWPSELNERSEIMANYAPTKYKDWLLEPGNIYTLKYRLLVFNGKMTKERANNLWEEYTNK